MSRDAHRIVQRKHNAADVAINMMSKLLHALHRNDDSEPPRQIPAALMTEAPRVAFAEWGYFCAGAGIFWGVLRKTMAHRRASRTDESCLPLMHAWRCSHGRGATITGRTT
jgi:hypothetical protein